ncbi:hypothetical protein HPP92_001146 [Vanilla planifolia]|uniref:Uncharacterized protein n=1 Tax=Vanilla planifolia TaxID=51239 RepID=A0A835RXM1_VANPL|nr:hypothetical protein HPP92_001146 [Vanilla planifolia]
MAPRSVGQGASGGVGGGQRAVSAYPRGVFRGKRAMYDAGLFDPFDDQDQDLTDFMEEMLSMMNSAKPEKPDTIQDLQKLFDELVNGMETGCAPWATRGPKRGP